MEQNERFLQIKKKYIGTFGQKQKDLQTAWNQRDLPELLELLHKLAGSSGGYGFMTLSDHCVRAREWASKDMQEHESEIEAELQAIYDILLHERTQLNG